MLYVALAGLVSAWLLGIFATLNIMDGVRLALDHAREQDRRGAAIMVGFTLLLGGLLITSIAGFAWIWNNAL